MILSYIPMEMSTISRERENIAVLSVILFGEQNIFITH